MLNRKESFSSPFRDPVNRSRGPFVHSQVSWCCPVPRPRHPSHNAEKCFGLAQSQRVQLAWKQVHGKSSETLCVCVLPSTHHQREPRRALGSSSLGLNSGSVEPTNLTEGSNSHSPFFCGESDGDFVHPRFRWAQQDGLPQRSRELGNSTLEDGPGLASRPEIWQRTPERSCESYPKKGREPLKSLWGPE